jgi:hypothetical protein
MIQISYPPASRVIRGLGGFPTPIGGDIFLPAGSDWQIAGTVDLLGNRIVCLGVVSINGISSGTSILKSTGLSGALITTEDSLTMQNLTITADNVFNIDGGGTAAIGFGAVNLIGCANIGTIQNVANFNVVNSAWRTSAGFIFDGTVGTVRFINSVFDTPPSGALITIAATAVVARRFSFNLCSMIIPAGVIGIDVISGASIPNDMFILNDIGFTGASTTYIQGVSANDNRNRWNDCRGIQNDGNSAYYYMSNNSTQTVISATNTFVDIAGTTTPGVLQRFAHSNNRVDYLGVLNKSFEAEATCTLTAGNNQTISLRFILRTAAGATKAVSPAIDVTTSGTGRSENIKVGLPFAMATGDYLRAQVANTNTTNIVVNDLIVIVK